MSPACPGGEKPHRSLAGEIVALARLSAPILVAQFAYMATAATDAVVAGRYDTTALAAIGLGAAVWVPITTFIGGVLYALLPQVAGHDAAGRDGEAGAATVQGAWLGVGIGLIGALLLLLAPFWLHHLGVKPDLVAPTAVYLAAVAPGLPFVGLSTAARFFCDGHSDTRPAMLVAVFIAVLNLPLDILLTFGIGAWPGWGLAGVGAASAICMAIGAALLWWRALSAVRYQQAGLARASLVPRIRALGALLAAGLPIGLAFLVEYSVMSAIAVLIAGTAIVAMAAHQIAFSVVMLLFTVPLSLSIGVSIRVGAAVGTEDVAAARLTLRAGLSLGLGFAAFGGLAMALMSERIAALYSADPAVIALAGRLITIAAVFQLLDAAQIVYGGALRGVGDVLVPLLMIGIAYWLIGMPIGWLGQAGLLPGPFADWLPPGDVAGWWVGLVFAISAIALLLALRARSRFSGATLSGSARPVEEEEPRRLPAAREGLESFESVGGTSSSNR